MKSRLKIGTRGSPLALAQADEVKSALLARHAGLKAEDIKIVVIKTSGDVIQDRLLLEEGGKGLFTKEIEEQLLAGKIDLAVHSSKDMPARLPRGLALEIFLRRENPQDAFISKSVKSLADLPQGAVLGTSSLRRQAQVLKLRPDLEVTPLRGNVETRLKKIEKGEVAATLLAVAGLKRLGLDGGISSFFGLDEMLPAPGQGAIAIETRAGDKPAQELLSPLNHGDSELAVRTERAVSLALGASCRMPLGAFARVNGGKISARAALFSPDGKNTWEAGETGPSSNPEELGGRLGKAIMEKADPEILKTYRIF